MGKHIQVRNVPDDVYDTLKKRVASKGVSLSNYLILEFEKLLAFQPFQDMAKAKQAAKRPTVTEIFDEIRQQGPVKPKIPVADLVRLERESR